MHLSLFFAIAIVHKSCVFVGLLLCLSTIQKKHTCLTLLFVFAVTHQSSLFFWSFCLSVFYLEKQKQKHLFLLFVLRRSFVFLFVFLFVHLLS